MQKILFILTIVIFSFLLLGCEATYKIIIDEDLTVTEKINFDYEVSDLEYFGDDYPFGDYNPIPYDVKDIKVQAEKEGYEVMDYSTSEKVDLTFRRKSNLTSFESPVFSNIYTYFDTECNERVCSIMSIARPDDIEGDGAVLNYKISITVPYNVIKHNADDIDLKNNTYIWYYSVTGESNIEFIFERQGINVIEANKRKTHIMLIVYIFIGLIVFAFLGYIEYRIIKNNRPSF